MGTGMTARATVLDRRLRACDLDGLPHEWDTRYELVGGVLFKSRRPSSRHQETIARVVVALYPPVSALGGKVLPEPGVLWEEEGEDNVGPGRRRGSRRPARHRAGEDSGRAQPRSRDTEHRHRGATA